MTYIELLMQGNKKVNEGIDKILKSCADIGEACDKIKKEVKK